MNTIPAIEKLFGELAVLASAIFSDKELAEVDRFIRVGEYGLALETAVDICAEEGKCPNQDFVAKVSELAEALQMVPAPLVLSIKNKP